MAKLIKKSKCKFESGIIVKKNKQIGIPYCVWCQLNKLELMFQQYNYLKSKPEYQAGPSLDEFKRISSLKSERPYIEMPDTPVLDRRVHEAMVFMEETDKINDAIETNEMIDEFGALIDWCANDKFIEGECYKLIDTPMLGNPLNLEPCAIAKILQMIVASPIKFEE